MLWYPVMAWEAGTFIYPGTSYYMMMAQHQELQYICTNNKQIK
jgi:hypothetical protein